VSRRSSDRHSSATCSRPPGARSRDVRTPVLPTSGSPPGAATGRRCRAACRAVIPAERLTSRPGPGPRALSAPSGCGLTRSRVRTARTGSREQVCRRRRGQRAPPRPTPRGTP
jgi:hypothetical protein